MSDSSLHLRVGEERSIRLPGLAAAGYAWFPEVSGSEPIVAITKASPHVHAEDVRTLPAGSSEDEVFVIKGIREGTTTVTMTQRRPWEKDGEPAARRELRVEVRT
jgi:predicted secreted protein